MAKRDAHLRSPDFFDIANHPQVRFVSDCATLEGETLRVRGQLQAAGRHVPVAVDATLYELDGGELQVEATTLVDHRELGMSWSPFGIMRIPSKLSQWPPRPRRGAAMKAITLNELGTPPVVRDDLDTPTPRARRGTRARACIISQPGR